LRSRKNGSSSEIGVVKGGLNYPLPLELYLHQEKHFWKKTLKAIKKN
jgi:hypothetical protein